MVFNLLKMNSIHKKNEGTNVVAVVLVLGFTALMLGAMLYAFLTM